MNINLTLTTSEIDLISINSSKEFTFRYLELNDYDKNYFDLLRQLTEAPTPSKTDFENQLNNLCKNQRTIVVENNETKTIVGSVSLIFESKFIRNLGTICHIEDFVIDSNYRAKGFGSTFLKMAESLAKFNNCYKMILSAGEKVEGFYEKFGFIKKSSNMQKYFVEMKKK